MAHQNSRRNTSHSIHNNSRRYSMYSTTTEMTNRTIGPTNSVEQRNTIFSDFKRIHMKSYSLDNLDDHEEEAENKPHMGRRLTFFGEKLPNTVSDDHVLHDMKTKSKIPVILVQETVGKHI